MRPRAAGAPSAWLWGGLRKNLRCAGLRTASTLDDEVLGVILQRCWQGLIRSTTSPVPV